MAHDEFENLRWLAGELESAPERAKAAAAEVDGGQAYQVGCLGEACRRAAEMIRRFIEVHEARK